uniref:Methyltransf_11 domain-containing protein n=1 Tax=Gongylonema pulchrum TaxID=637853 RepID=A0A183EPR5_9BILA
LKEHEILYGNGVDIAVAPDLDPFDMVQLDCFFLASFFK